MHLKNFHESVIYNLYDNFNYKLYICIIIIIISILCIFSIIPYYEFNNYNLYITNNYYTLIVDNKFFPVPDKLYIENKKYDFEINNIGDSNLIDNNKYYEISIKVDLPKKLLKKNNIILVKVLRNKTTLIKMLIHGLGR